MDFLVNLPNMCGPLLPNSTLNITANHTAGFLAGTETFFDTTLQASPIFPFIRRLVDSHFGFDPTIILTIVGISWGWGIHRLILQLYLFPRRLFDRYFLYTIYVHEHDPIFNELMDLLSQLPDIKNNTSLMACTIWKGLLDDYDDHSDALSSIDSGGLGNSSDEYPNFSTCCNGTSVSFRPAAGFTTFRYGYRRFYVHLQTEHTHPAAKPTQIIGLSCYALSMRPIKKLLKDAKDFYTRDRRLKTSIFHPRPGYENNPWKLVASRYNRSICTIALDGEKKREILDNIEEYLRPETKIWYSLRGIPFRRGYLFHGPPGTGKSSLSFALAGVFGINMYIISLQDADITEQHMALLFRELPRRCIVLLEDIDTAGLKRDAHTAHGSTDGTDGTDGDGNRRKNISLSGLLNAIDGVASHEGRILIITTNRPETLDDALVRPGRVDLRVAFTHSTSEQAGELYRHMYKIDMEPHIRQEKDEWKAKVHGDPKNGADLCEKFASLVPDGLFSAAEIQGFLLARKNQPQKALDDAPAWIKEKQEVQSESG
ncbi:hypothetical protein S40285_09137 [Stachybotrys chlorohalonatus IBT 40285]|uniref:AAA+ ATPase domain-containing protein n=1 Tax=Stachybotrys chlorohalonatus (strain IBT 40285) TaxID=1283841 RepID=A0A084QZA9_STAC4|nr:hypothetical protein S40285_09137 [Stachybotrys chlorohalonata IBT 40285]